MKHATIFRLNLNSKLAKETIATFLDMFCNGVAIIWVISSVLPY